MTVLGETSRFYEMVTRTIVKSNTFQMTVVI